MLLRYGTISAAALLTPAAGSDLPQFVLGQTFARYDPTIEGSSRREWDIDGSTWLFEFLDLNSTVHREGHIRPHPGIYDRMLMLATGIVLLYDVTSRESFERVTDSAYLYAWTCRTNAPRETRTHPTQRQKFGCVLVGNKADLVQEDHVRREVSRDEAEQWAHSQGFTHVEITTNSRHEVETAIEALARNIRKIELRDGQWVEEQKRLDKQRKKSITNTVKKILAKSSS